MLKFFINIKALSKIIKEVRKDVKVSNKKKSIFGKTLKHNKKENVESNNKIVDSGKCEKKIAYIDSVERRKKNNIAKRLNYTKMKQVKSQLN